MSEGNVEKLRELYALRSLRDFIGGLHPEAELHQPSDLPDSDDYYGPEEFARGVRLWLEEWDDFQYIPEDVIDLGDRALMHICLTGRGRTSGITLDSPAFHLWTFRDGKPWRCDVFFDEAAAQRAAGL